MKSNQLISYFNGILVIIPLGLLPAGSLIDKGNKENH